MAGHSWAGMKKQILALIVSGAIAACSGYDNGQTTDPTNSIVAGQVTIALPKTVYTIAELSPSGSGVRATLGNTSDQTFYSMLGDAFNGAIDQNPLFVANGSDASLQRQQGSDWVAVSGLNLVEGVKVVSIQPGKSYDLIAQSNAVTAGQYRIVVAYRNSATAEATQRTVSSTFEVR